jgi:hypothetical protein
MGIVSKFLDGVFFPTIWKDGIKVVDVPQPIEFSGAEVSVTTADGRTLVTIGSIGGALPGSPGALLYNNAGLIGASTWATSGQGITNTHSAAFIGLGGTPPGAGAVRLANDRWVFSRTTGGADSPLVGLDAFNQYRFGYDLAGTTMFFGVGASGTYNFQVNNATVASISATGIGAFAGVSCGTTPALSGHVRGPASMSAYSRNTLNTVDLPVYRNVSDVLVLGGGTEGWLGVWIETTSGPVRFRVGGTTRGEITATAADFSTVALTAASLSAPSVVSTGVAHYQHARSTGVTTPAQITANQNDYAPASLATASVLRLSSDAVRRITGLDSTGLGAGPIRTLINVGSHPIILSDQDAASGTSNRFQLGGHDVVLAPDQAITLWLDVSGPNRWRPMGCVEQYTPTHGVTLADANATLTADQGAVRRIPVLTANRTYDIDNTNAVDEEIVVLVRDGAEAFTATIRDHADAPIATFPASRKLAGSFKKITGSNFQFVGFQRIN